MTLKLHRDGGSKGKVVFYREKKIFRAFALNLLYILSMMTGKGLYFEMGIQQNTVICLNVN